MRWQYCKSSPMASMTVLSKSHNNCLANFWLAHLQAVGALDVILWGQKDCFLGDSALNAFVTAYFVLVFLLHLGKCNWGCGTSMIQQLLSSDIWQSTVALFIGLARYFPPLDLVQPPLVVAICGKFWYYYFSVAFLPLLVHFSLKFS